MRYDGVFPSVYALRRGDFNFTGFLFKHQIDTLLSQIIEAAAIGLDSTCTTMQLIDEVVDFLVAYGYKVEHNRYGEFYIISWEDEEKKKEKLENNTISKNIYSKFNYKDYSDDFFY